MLSVAGCDVKSIVAANWKIDIDAKTWRQQQTRQQRETARDWLGAALSQLCRRHGEQRPPEFRPRGVINVIQLQKYRYGSCYFFPCMRQVKLTGREASV